MSDSNCLWMVVVHSDYSGTRVFEDKAKAIEDAKIKAAEYRHQVAIYRCHLEAVMIPREPEMHECSASGAKVNPIDVEPTDKPGAEQ